MTMRLFAQIMKVDEAKREVIGRAVQEVPDRADEIFDYASSKPHFEEWSKSFAADTDGKSLGNLRAMHGKVAAGKLTAIDFNDTDKAIDIRAKVVDGNEWEKVLAGVYTGFSIGGSYVGERKTEKMDDGREVKRYTARPSEISLVDSPCIPTAKFFEVVKADGAVVKTEFKPREPEPLEVKGDPESIVTFAKLLNDSGLTMADAIGAVAELAMLDTIESLKKREFSADERKAAAKDGAALPDGSFPIKSVGDLDNAIRAYGRAKDKAAAKAHIIKRAKALGASDKLPESWTKGEKVEGGELKKGMWNVSDFASCLASCASIARSAQCDLEAEGDDSPVPMKLRNWIGDGVELFKEMSAEEADELLAELKEHAGVPEDDGIEQALEAAHKAAELVKRVNDPKLPLADLIKLADEHLSKDDLAAIDKVEGLTPRVDAMKAAIVAKAKMPQAHADKLQAIHDHVASMGAACASAKAEPAGDLAKAATDKIATLETQNAELAARLKKLEDQPVPHVVLTAVQKSLRVPAQPTNQPEEPAAVALTKDDYVFNPDRTIDYAASVANKRAKLALASSAGN